MSFTTNYSCKNIIKQINNYEFLDNNSSSTSNRSLSISLTIDVDFNQLDRQSKVFSDNYIQHGYVEFSKVLRCRYEDVRNNLKNLYIYSFVKCLHNGLFFNNINEHTKQGLCFRGHAAFYQLLRNPNFVYRSDNYSVTALLTLPGFKEKNILMSLLLRKYPFLKDGISNIDSVGNTPFMHSEWEAKFNYLLNNLTVNNKIVSFEMGDESKIDNKHKDNNKYRKSILNTSTSDDKLVILELKDSVAISIVESNNNPITNVLLKKDSDVLYFSPVISNNGIENNPSFFFNLANFIRLKDSSDKNLSKYYSSNSYSVDKCKHFICSEVFTNTGIKCYINSDDYNESDIDFIPTIEDIMSNLSNDNNDIISNINDTILDIITNKIKDKASKDDSIGNDNLK